MANKLNIVKPSTVYLTAANSGPVKIYTNGKLYAEKNTTGGKFKINLPVPAVYSFTGVPLKLQKIGPLEIVNKTIELPTPDRNKEVGLEGIFFDDSSNSPARIYTNEKTILVNKKFFEYPIEVRMFILLHEIGHFFYTEEWKCDTFAAYHFLKMGFNPSQAFESLAGVLHPSERNDERIKNIYNLMKI